MHMHVFSPRLVSDWAQMKQTTIKYELSPRLKDEFYN